MKKLKVLYAEDDTDLRNAISNFLKSKGYEVVAVEDGGLLIYELHHQGDFDVLVTDFEMPWCNGVEAITFIKQESRYKDLPIILCSGHDLTQKAADLKVTFLQKSFAPETLYQLIELSRNPEQVE